MSARSIILLILIVAFPPVVLALSATTVCRTNGSGCGPSGTDFGVLSLVMIGEAGLILGLVLSIINDEREQHAQIPTESKKQLSS